MNLSFISFEARGILLKLQDFLLKDNIDEWFSSFLSSINVVVVCEYKFHLRNKRISQNERPFYADR